MRPRAGAAVLADSTTGVFRLKGEIFANFNIIPTDCCKMTRRRFVDFQRFPGQLT
jgi:hypothetical protein